ncbi:unnamed protein product [Diatraea saccharalis]|uniref:Oxoglutarate/iron-dependent oxygenase C-terminal degradation domain-containing protein n=1 Tax=Diatraea saccharalis TaxID=40085 RepID=A0A9N9N1F3_9NEOP|nr:unnamed protein product [Diatraea saccharalis]
MFVHGRVCVAAGVSERVGGVDVHVAAEPRADTDADGALQRDVEWEWSGPLHQRRYEQVRAQWAQRDEKHVVRGALRLLASSAFCRLLHACTDIQVQHHAPPQLQRWTPGSFTLLPPREHYQQPRLEVVMYLGVPQRRIAGASTLYVAPEDEAAGAASAGGAGGAGGAGSTGGAAAAAGAGAGAALVTLPPVNNALNLVYCDAGAASFTEYLSRLGARADEPFYILTCTYKE